MRLNTTERIRGFSLCYLYLRIVKGCDFNNTTNYRIYSRGLRLNLQIKPKKQLIRNNHESFDLLEAINQVWLVYFKIDTLVDGRTIRTFNAIVDYKRQAFVMEVDLSLPSNRFSQVLDQIRAWRKKPISIRLDSVPEHLSHHFKTGPKSITIQPDQPQQNAHVERLNRTARHECLYQKLFNPIEQARETTTGLIWL